MSEKTHAHFKGKDALSHVIEARLKGKEAFSEIHGTDVPAHLFFATEATKETAMLALILWILFTSAYGVSILWIAALGWLIIKTAQVAYLGWARLERLHRLIEEERWEIEHHRQQEREELTALYQAKGFSGKLLEEVIDVLMSDDHRLLQVMLEEELGLTLKAFEHPLKQAFGAFLGIIFSSSLLALGLWASPSYGIFISVAALIIGATAWIAKKEKRKIFAATLYSCGIAALSGLVCYFLQELM